MKCNCPRQEELRTLRTYEAGNTGGTSEMSCPCGKRFTCVKILLHEIEKRGQGAFAVAQQMKQGRIPPIQPLPTTEERDVEEE